MLKHCQGSSVRLQRRVNNHQPPDTVSLASNATIRSNGESSDSSLNSSFNINTTRHNTHTTGESMLTLPPSEIFNVRNALFDRCSSNSGLYNHGNGGSGVVPSSHHRYAGFHTPDPGHLSLSSRASSYASLATTTTNGGGGSGPRTPIRVFASCLRPDIEYKTLSVGSATSARDVIWQLLSKFKMKHRDPKLFFLTMEVVIQTPGRDGLTKKTLVLDDDSRPAELKQCNPWGECRFTLQMKKGGLVKIYDSVLMEGSQYKCLLISEDTSVVDVVNILLYCYGRAEPADRYCVYEQCSAQHYQRRLSASDRPLHIQSLWPDCSSRFNFVLRRSPARIEDNVWNRPYAKIDKPVTSSSRSDTALSPVTTIGGGGVELVDVPAWPVLTEWSTQSEEEQEQVEDRMEATINERPASSSTSITSSTSSSSTCNTNSYTYLRLHPSQTDQLHNQPSPCRRLPHSCASPERTILLENNRRNNMRSYQSNTTTPADFQPRHPTHQEEEREEEEEPWPELDKDSEEHISSSEDMDTSLSSNGSPTPPPPGMTSTPVCASDTSRRRSNKPAMCFLYPSPDYASFPNHQTSSTPVSRPYSSLSVSCASLGPVNQETTVTATATTPCLPPKPAAGIVQVSIFPKNGTSPSTGSSGFHDYENYFYI